MQNNAYLLYQNGEGILIDAPKHSHKTVMDFCNKNNVALKAVYFTHGHWDHILDARLFKESGAKIYVAKADEHYFFDAPELWSMPVEMPSVKSDFYLNDGDILTEAGITVKVITTPGHTEGGVCFVCGGNIFTGDTLFYGTYGRVDLQGGSLKVIKDSIFNKLFALEGDYTVYPGHERATTLSAERLNNEIFSD